MILTDHFVWTIARGRGGWRELFSLVSDWTAVVLVFHEQRESGESLRAVAAPVLLDLRMSLKMGSKVWPISEGSTALGASERFLSGVRPQVTLKEPRSRERLSADMTLARKSVSPGVHLHRTQRRVDLRTLSAVEALRSGGRGMRGTVSSATVEVPVPLQTAGRGESSSATIAPETICRKCVRSDRKLRRALLVVRMRIHEPVDETKTRWRFTRTGSQRKTTGRAEEIRRRRSSCRRA